MPSLNVGQILNVVSAGSGIIGTLILFTWSFAFESFPFFTNKELTEAMTKRNRRRMVMQRIGLLFILLSFVLQGISQFVPVPSQQAASPVDGDEKSDSDNELGDII